MVFDGYFDISEAISALSHKCPQSTGSLDLVLAEAFIKLYDMGKSAAFPGRIQGNIVKRGRGEGSA